MNIDNNTESMMENNIVKKDENAVCPCCDRRCPIDNLRCPKGKEHFGVTAEGREAEERDGHEHQHNGGRGGCGRGHDGEGKHRRGGCGRGGEGEHRRGGCGRGGEGEHRRGGCGRGGEGEHRRGGCGCGGESRNGSEGRLRPRMLDETNMTASEITMALLRQCGHFLHHYVGTHVDCSKMFEMLTSEEQVQLNATLKKCLAGWENQ